MFSLSSSEREREREKGGREWDDLVLPTTVSEEADIHQIRWIGRGRGAKMKRE